MLHNFQKQYLTPEDCKKMLFFKQPNLSRNMKGGNAGFCCGCVNMNATLSQQEVHSCHLPCLCCMVQGLSTQAVCLVHICLESNTGV